MLRDLFCSPPLMASVLQLKQDFDYDVDKITEEFLKLSLGIFHPFVVQLLTGSYLVHIMNSVLLSIYLKVSLNKSAWDGVKWQ